MIRNFEIGELAGIAGIRLHPAIMRVRVLDRDSVGLTVVEIGAFGLIFYIWVVW